jgi:hypothetical protein
VNAGNLIFAFDVVQTNYKRRLPVAFSQAPHLPRERRATTLLTVVPCFIDLIESTLSAHSYDFVANNLGQGSHAIQASWSVFGTNNNTQGGSTMACVGPGLMTVTQVKNFSQNSSISF